jgi:aminoglycoside phosphotransferase
MSAPVRTPGGYAESEMYDALHRLCAKADLDPTGAVLLRGQTNAVLRLASAPVVVKIARRGAGRTRFQHTVDLVRWLSRDGFPTVELHPELEQPVTAGENVATFWSYLPQPPTPVAAERLAAPLRRLHTCGLPPVPLEKLDAVTAIRRSLAGAATLPPDDLNFLRGRLGLLADEIDSLPYTQSAVILHGDPQHGNALYDGDRVVLCDWDSAVIGPMEWDLVTVEIHCRRFGHGHEAQEQFATNYGLDVREWPGYRVLRDLRELRMITTNARKSAAEPDKMTEIRRRIAGLRREDPDMLWQIM